MLPHLVGKFENQKCQIIPWFDSVNSRNSVPNVEDGAHVVNPGEYDDTGTHLFACYFKDNNATYFGGFGVEYQGSK